MDPHAANTPWHYGPWRRLRTVLSEAPWSNHDLLVGVSLSAIGLVLLLNPAALYLLRALAYLAKAGPPHQWGCLFLAIGMSNILVVLWSKPPPFLIRLLARMAGAFAFLTLALSHMMFSVLIPPTAIYLSVAVWSVWGILRTQSSGR